MTIPQTLARRVCLFKAGWGLCGDHASVGVADEPAMGTTAYRRELRLNTYLDSNANITRGPARSAPNYLLLLSMAVQGFGWCVLPCALVEEFAAEKPLAQLDVLAGRGRLLLICCGTRKRRPERRGTGFATICSRNKLRHRQISVISFVIKLTFLNNQDN